MVDQLKGKKVPWSDMEKYLKTHKAAIVTYQDQLENNLAEIPDIEPRLPKSFLQLYEVITKILEDNNLLPKKEESKTSNDD
jgi:hypothetical protein